MTNGEKLCIDFPNMRYTISSEHRVVTTIGVAASFDLEWWNAEYKEPTPKKNLVVDMLKEIGEEIAKIEEGISSYHNDRPWIFKDEALNILDKKISDLE